LTHLLAGPYLTVRRADIDAVLGARRSVTGHNADDDDEPGEFVKALRSRRPDALKAATGSGHDVVCGAARQVDNVHDDDEPASS
jgi:hypothetical protein